MQNKATSFRAYGKPGYVTRNTPKEAALAYFAEFPTSRKCDIQEGMLDGVFFTVTYNLHVGGVKPLRFKDVSKKTANTIGE